MRWRDDRDERKKEEKTIWVKLSVRPILEDPLALINPFFSEKKAPDFEALKRGEITLLSEACKDTGFGFDARSLHF